MSPKERAQIEVPAKEHIPKQSVSLSRPRRPNRLRAASLQRERAVTGIFVAAAQPSEAQSAAEAEVNKKIQRIDDMVANYQSIDPAKRVEREVVLHELLSEIYPFVISYCTTRVQNALGIEISPDDIAQEVALAVVDKVPSYVSKGAPFIAFVYGIARHKIIDTYRSVQSRDLRERAMEEVPDVAEDDNPERRVLRGEMQEKLGKLLNALPGNQKEILELRIIHELDAEAAAKVLGSTAGAVRAAQLRALTRLRRQLPGLYQLPESELGL